jgi:exodeoxyribonuclease VII small subunit
MNNPPNDAVTFERALQELEVIVQKLEAGQIGLEEALAHYENGVKLLRHCHLLLQNAESRVKKLAGLDEEGRPVEGEFRNG